MAHGLHDRIPVRRHPIAELDVFEVSNEELDQLERAGLHGAESFGFLIFGFSVGISLTVTLTTVDIHSDRLFESFLMPQSSLMWWERSLGSGGFWSGDRPRRLRREYEAVLVRSETTRRA
jgi:hypothetical protein